MLSMQKLWVLTLFLNFDKVFSIFREFGWEFQSMDPDTAKLLL